MSTSSDLRLGVDLGGTKIEAIVLELLGDGSFADRGRVRVETEQHRGYEWIVRNVVNVITAVAKKAPTDLSHLPIGVGMPGGTRRDGMVKNSNTTCLNGRPFRQDLIEAVGYPIAFENDANCFALAETRFGAARAYRDGVVFGVIMGTGVGGGVVMHDRLWPGPMGIAGEWGHHSVYAVPRGRDTEDDLRSCYCGKRGCVEVYVSGPAVQEDYKRRSGRALRMETIIERRHDDPHAEAAVNTFLDAFARGLANVIDVLDPSAIVLGGGLSNIDLLYDEGVDRIAELVFNEALSTPVLRPELGDSAGVIGAALLTT